MGKILVVEDEPDLLMLVETLLTIEGHEVTGVGTGQGALDHAADADVILLDIRLPDITGVEVVKQLSAAIRTRVLFMSAHADMNDRDLAKTHGCAGFLIKPFDFDEMCREIKKILRDTTG